MSALKLEYCDGVIYALAGGTRAHAELSAAVIIALHRVLPKSCRVSTSDMKVRIDASDLSTFPDVSVICGEPFMSSLDANALSNPTLLVEVTSKGTEDYDRGDKLSHYKQLPSLQVVLFVSHRTPCSAHPRGLGRKRVPSGRGRDDDDASAEIYGRRGIILDPA